MTGDSKYAALMRQLMTTRLVDKRYIRTDAVEQAFRSVPRHLFATNVSILDAYRDRRIAQMQGSCLTPPSLTAQILEQLDVHQGQRVLEIGAGTGYNAALLADLVGSAGEVVTIEIGRPLADAARRHLIEAGKNNVRVVCADGYFGWPARAPYDRILLTAASDRVSPHWERQLSKDGRLQLPLVLSGSVQKSVSFLRSAELTLTSTSVVDCFFVPQRGKNDIWSRSWIPLEAVRGLSAAGNPELDSNKLYRCLCRKPSDLATGVAANAFEIASGLNAWLATKDHRCITLHQSLRGNESTAFANLSGVVSAATIGLYIEGQLALLAPRPDHECAARRGDVPIALVSRSYGDANDLAGALRNLTRSWAAAGRPSSKQLVISVAPHGGGFRDTRHAQIVKRGSCVLCFDWELTSPQAPPSTFH